MESKADLKGWLRERIVRDLHLGHLRTGDRLPSIREVSRDLSADSRRVVRAYRELEAEGLVEIRGRSGVYVADQEQKGGELLAETQRWMAGVLVEAWTRRINIPDYPDLVRRCTRHVRVRCACVESVQDTLVAYCAELREEWGFETFSVAVSAPGAEIDDDMLALALGDADLIATTSFHAVDVRRVAEALRTPVIVLKPARDLEEAIRRRLQQGQLTVVALDPALAGRLRAVYGEGDAAGGQIRVVMADDSEAVQALDPSEPVLLTRAAGERLRDVDNPLILPNAPRISRECAGELAETLIRLNMQARLEER